MSTGARRDWDAIARSALADLVAERLVAPWGEVEARIADAQWKDFGRAQPLHLTSARRALHDSGDIVYETSNTAPSVSTVRVPFPRGRKREIERLRGEKRKLYRRYLAWTQDGALCGKHAERLVLRTLQDAALEAQLTVPAQRVGNISTIGGIDIGYGPLDALAFAADMPAASRVIPLAIEVKNIRAWVYPWTGELWELLVKAATVAVHRPVVPLLVCRRSDFQTNNMAKDVGFFNAQLRAQVFHPIIGADNFDAVTQEFGLPIVRHDDVLQPLHGFLTKVLRVPPQSPPEEDIEWFVRQADRFSALAPTVLDHDSLAGHLPDAARRAVFARFRAKAHEVRTWDAVRGW